MGLKTLGTSRLVFEHGSEWVFKSLGSEPGNKGTMITMDNAQRLLFHVTPFPFQPVLTKKTKQKNKQTMDLYC